mmetsp:Transcript_4017/g.10280  ORF Transcript_4017/g.10280 Transcript_4017/m.10280 type:complete len:271 (-) Transcript_4017:49-861(-)
MNASAEDCMEGSVDALANGSERLRQMSVHPLLVRRHHLHLPSLPAPLQGGLVAVEEEVQPGFPLDGRTLVLHPAPPVARHVHARPERVLVEICRDGARLSHQEPGKEASARCEDHRPPERPSIERPRPRLPRQLSHRRQPFVRAALEGCGGPVAVEDELLLLLLVLVRVAAAAPDAQREGLQVHREVVAGAHHEPVLPAAALAAAAVRRRLHLPPRRAPWHPSPDQTPKGLRIKNHKTSRADRPLKRRRHARPSARGGRGWGRRGEERPQ